MPVIRVIGEFDDVLHERTIASGVTFADAAMAEWPEGFPGLTIFVMDPSMKMVTAAEAISVPMVDNDVWTIALRPQAPLGIVAFTLFSGTAFAISVTWLQVAILAANLALNYLMRPEIPSISAQYQWDDSDRPQFFSAQSNGMQPGSRVPEVFGRIRIWPDLIAEPWVVYSGDSQEVRELYVVSNGKCAIAEPRLHDEAITTLPASSITVYQPGAAWPVDFPIMRTNTFVATVELPGPNEKIQTAQDMVISTSGSSLFVDSAGYFDPFGPEIGEFFTLHYDDMNISNRDIYRLVSISGDGKTMVMSPAPGSDFTIQANLVTFRAVKDVATDGADARKYTGVAWELNNIDGRFMTSLEQIAPNVDNNAIMYDPVAGNDNNDVLFQSVSASTGEVWANRFWTPQGNTTAADFFYLKWASSGFDPNLPGDGFTTSIFNIPGSTTECLFDVEFPGGLYQQVAGGEPKNREVEIEFYWRLVGDATWKSKVFGYNALTRTPRRFTTTVIWADEGDPTGIYECYFRRATDWVPNTSDTVTVDACRLIGLRGRQDASELTGDLLNVTLVELHLTTQNAQQIAQSRSFNVRATRHLPNYYDGGVVESTRKVRDAILYTLIDDAGISIDNIDIAALDAIHDDLNAISVDDQRFNGIIDQTMAIDDQLTLLCAPFRIVPFRRAGYISFSRLKAGLIPRGLINARNKIEPESRTMNFSMSNEPDAVVIRYMDEADDFNEKTIQFPGAITPIRPSEQTLLGVTKTEVVARIAQFMWERRIYERDTLEVTTTEDSILLAPGEIIAVTDHLRVEKPIDGEVVEIIANDTFRFDDAIPAGTYIGRLRDMNGDMISTEISITLTDDSDTHTIPEWAGATQSNRNTTQVGLLYSFTPVGTAADSELWHVQSVAPSRDGRVKVACIQYSDDAYAADAAVVTAATSAVKRVRTGGA